MGVAWPLAGGKGFHKFFPGSMSEARKNGADVPGMKHSPPSVATGPPRLVGPGGMGGCLPPKSCIEPNGTCQRIFPSVISTAESVPHGGATQGIFEGDCRKRRNNP